MQFNKLKSGINNVTQVTLNLLSNVAGDSNDEANFPHRLLTNTSVSKIFTAFSNDSSNNITFSQTQLSEVIQLREFVGKLIHGIEKAMVRAGVEEVKELSKDN